MTAERAALEKQAEKQKQEMADLQEAIQNYTDHNQGVQSELAQLDPQIAVLANKLENLNNRIKEKQGQNGQAKSRFGSSKTRCRH